MCYSQPVYRKDTRKMRRTIGTLTLLTVMAVGTAALATQDSDSVAGGNVIRCPNSTTDNTASFRTIYLTDDTTMPLKELCAVPTQEAHVHTPVTVTDWDALFPW